MVLNYRVYIEVPMHREGEDFRICMDMVQDLGFEEQFPKAVAHLICAMTFHKFFLNGSTATQMSADDVVHQATFVRVRRAWYEVAVKQHNVLKGYTDSQYRFDPNLASIRQMLHKLQDMGMCHIVEKDGYTRKTNFTFTPLAMDILEAQNTMFVL